MTPFQIHTKYIYSFSKTKCDVEVHNIKVHDYCFDVIANRSEITIAGDQQNHESRLLFSKRHEVNKMV